MTPVSSHGWSFLLIIQSPTPVLQLSGVRGCAVSPFLSLTGGKAGDITEGHPVFHTGKVRLGEAAADSIPQPHSHPETSPLPGGSDGLDAGQDSSGSCFILKLWMWFFFLKVQACRLIIQKMHDCIHQWSLGSTQCPSYPQGARHQKV